MSEFRSRRSGWGWGWRPPGRGVVHPLGLLARLRGLRLFGLILVGIFSPRATPPFLVCVGVPLLAWLEPFTPFLSLQTHRQKFFLIKMLFQRPLGSSANQTRNNAATVHPEPIRVVALLHSFVSRLYASCNQFSCRHVGPQPPASARGGSFSADHTRVYGRPSGEVCPWGAWGVCRRRPWSA